MLFFEGNQAFNCTSWNLEEARDLIRQQSIVPLETKFKKWNWKLLSRVRLFVTPGTIQSMEFFRPGLGSLSLLQGIFPTQGSTPGLLHCRQILYQLSHKGSPRILEWVAYPFSSRSSQPRNWTGVSCISGGFFTYWAMRETQQNLKAMYKPNWLNFCFAEINYIFSWVLPYISSPSKRHHKIMRHYKCYVALNKETLNNQCL